MTIFYLFHFIFYLDSSTGLRLGAEENMTIFYLFPFIFCLVSFQSCFSQISQKIFADVRRKQLFISAYLRFNLRYLREPFFAAEGTGQRELE